MSFGMGWQLLNYKPRQRCPRCTLKYAKDLQQCPHCSDLNSTELTELKISIEQNHRANFRLGKLFIYMALLVTIGLLLINS